jgi:hypothetical protein
MPPDPRGTAAARPNAAARGAPFSSLLQRARPARAAPARSAAGAAAPPRAHRHARRPPAAAPPRPAPAAAWHCPLVEALRRAAAEGIGKYPGCHTPAGPHTTPPGPTPPRFLPFPSPAPGHCRHRAKKWASKAKHIRPLKFRRRAAARARAAPRQPAAPARAPRARQTGPPRAPGPAARPDRSCAHPPGVPARAQPLPTPPPRLLPPPPRPRLSSPRRRIARQTLRKRRQRCAGGGRRPAASRPARLSAAGALWPKTPNCHAGARAGRAPPRRPGVAPGPPPPHLPSRLRPARRRRAAAGYSTHEAPKPRGLGARNRLH